MSEIKDTSRSLLLRIRDARDQAAWGEFAEIYTPLIFRFCRSRRLQEADASDVTQDVLRAVAQSIGGFDYEPRRGKFRSWLFKVVRSKLSNFIEARRRNPQGTGSTTLHERLEEQPAEDTEESWDREYIEHVLRWASERVRSEFQERTWQAFWRTAVQSEAAAKVAESLEMTIGAVYVARSRVLGRLKEKLAAVEEEWAPAAGGSPLRG